MSQTGTESASRELVPYTPPAPKSLQDRLSGLLGSTVLKVATVAVAFAAGWAAGSGALLGEQRMVADEADQRILALQAEIHDLKVRMSSQLQVDRQDFAGMQTGIEEMQRQTASSLLRFNDVVERAESDRAADLARITERLGRLEKQMSDPMPVATIPKAQLPAPASAPPSHSSANETTRVPMAQSAPTKPAEPAIKGYVLRGVADGVALVQTRGGLREIAPGDKLAGAGRVQSIEKRGRKWVIVTTEGVIDGDVTVSPY